jgi:membrane protease YdiL (CAAX protease family)
VTDAPAPGPSGTRHGSDDARDDDGPGSVRPVASARHTIVLLLVLVAVAVSGVSHASHGASRPAITHLAQYTALIVMEWLLFLFVRRGVRAHGTPLADVAGRRWASWREAWKPLVAAAVFWVVKSVVLVALQRGLDAAGHGGAEEMQRIARLLLPDTAIEGTVWVLLSISAGVCEEFVYRGYLQRQFSAFTRNRTAGLLLSALAFGLSHAYQGPSAVIRITVYGALFGALATTTRSLLPGILAHATEDIVSGLSLNP